jgi:hypothetical protein
VQALTYLWIGCIFYDSREGRNGPAFMPAFMVAGDLGALLQWTANEATYLSRTLA